MGFMLNGISFEFLRILGIPLIPCILILVLTLKVEISSESLFDEPEESELEESES